MRLEGLGLFRGKRNYFGLCVGAGWQMRPDQCKGNEQEETEATERRQDWATCVTRQGGLVALRGGSLGVVSCQAGAWELGRRRVVGIAHPTKLGRCICALL